MKTKRSFSLLLALFLLSTGCGQTSPDTENTTAGETTEAPVFETDLYAYHRGTDYGGKKVTILLREEFKDEFAIEESTGDIVDDAVFRRNIMVEELLGVKLGFVSLPGSFSNQSTFKKAVAESVLAEDHAYDLVASAANYMLSLTTEGYFRDLMSCPGVQINEPWYARNYIENMCVGRKLYLVAGSASLNFLQNMCVVFFNKDLMTDLSYEAPYDAVRDGKWTFDAMNSLVKDSGADLNGDGKFDETDRIGWLTYSNMVNAQIVGMGHHYIERKSDGTPYVVSSLSERSVSGYDRVESFINEQDSTFYYVDNDHDALKATENLMKIWNTGNTLFYPQVLSTSEKMRDSSFDFGILPFPKADEEQESYKTFLLENVTVLGIPRTADAELSGRVLDALSINGYSELSPVYFDIALKEKYSRDADTKDMLDIIRGSVEFEYPLATQFMAGCIQAKKPLVSSYEELKNSIIKQFDDIVGKYRELD